MLMAALAMLAGTFGCASQQRRPAPSLDDVVRMSVEGRTDEEIIALLIESRAVYPLTSSTIVNLHEQGVTMAVLDHMQQAFINFERSQERMLYTYPYWGYPCFGCGYNYMWGPPYYWGPRYYWGPGYYMYRY